MAPLTDISLRAFAQQNSGEPISRTMQYRKITKPLLERQRRARINRSLDELKEILITGLQSEGENVARLEKADILELTVRHLHKLTSQLITSGPPTAAATIITETNCIHNIAEDEKFRTGFSTCAKEVSRLLATTPKMDIQVGTSLMVHLGHALNQITHNKPHNNARTTMLVSTSPSSTCSSSPMPSPSSSIESYRPYTPPSSPEENDIHCFKSPSSRRLAKKQMWRPW